MCPMPVLLEPACCTSRSWTGANASAEMRRKSYSGHISEGTVCPPSPIYPGPRLSRRAGTCPSLKPWLRPRFSLQGRHPSAPGRRDHPGYRCNMQVGTSVSSSISPAWPRTRIARHFRAMFTLPACISAGCRWPACCQMPLIGNRRWPLWARCPIGRYLRAVHSTGMPVSLLRAIVLR